MRRLLVINVLTILCLLTNCQDCENMNELVARVHTLIKDINDIVEEVGNQSK